MSTAKQTSSVALAAAGAFVGVCGIQTIAQNISYASATGSALSISFGTVAAGIILPAAMIVSAVYLWNDTSGGAPNLAPEGS